MIRLAVLLLLLSLMVGAGAASAQLPPGYWCYNFDYLEEDYSLDFPSAEGEWINGEGVASTGLHPMKMAFTWVHDRPVAPVMIALSIRASYSAELPPFGSEVYLTLELFGITATRSVRLTESRPALTLQFEPSVPGNQGTSIIVQGIGQSRFTIDSIVVYGTDVFEFDTLPVTEGCDGVTAPGIGATPIPIPAYEMFQQVATANARIENLPSDLTIVDGEALLPDLPLDEVFGYAKWITSPAGADEIGGPFATAISHIGTAIQLVVVMGGVYITIYAIVYILRWVLWLLKKIKEIAEAVMTFASGGLSWLFKFLR